MNSDEQDTYATFRRIGSTGLVIFERDGTLLRKKSTSRNFMLGDISEEFVEMLRQLRELNVRFGFISDERGMDAGSRGRSEFVVLTRLLDELLRIRGAMPDFWMAWSETPQEIGTELRHRNDRREKRGGGMILQAIEWYGVDKDKAVFVSSSATGILAAHNATVTDIRYFGWRNDGALLAGMKSETQGRSSAKITEIRRLRVTIEQVLRLGRHRTA